MFTLLQQQEVFGEKSGLSKLDNPVRYVDSSPKSCGFGVFATKMILRGGKELKGVGNVRPRVQLEEYQKERKYCLFKGMC